MAEALYRKYRPQVFGDVVGQDHIEQTIKNAIEQDKVSHAYLFCGPRGTGKTTTARLLAKALLCKNGPTPNPDGTCEDCQMIALGEHPDVYELDAASRTGVENVREEIIGRVQFAPTRGSYKVYIIDEVHMLSTAAFNALLKTLEEPPSHVVFVLCTTDPQKVPETIHSRCQRFTFRRIGNEGIVGCLARVCEAEGARYEMAALELIAQRAEGGMRNALTGLEQVLAFGQGEATVDVANQVFGGAVSTDFSGLMEAIGSRDGAACFRWVDSFMETGADVAQFTRALASHVRNLYVLSLAGGSLSLQVGDPERAMLERELPAFGPDRAARMLGVLGDLLAELKTSTNARLSFEIALTRMIRPDSDLTLEALAERIEALESGYSAVSHVTSAGQGMLQPVVAAAPVPAPQPVAAAAAPAPAQPMPAPQPAPAPAPQPVAAPQPMAPQPAPAPVAQQPQPVVAPQAPAPRPAPAPAPAPQRAAAPQPMPAPQPAPQPAAAPAPQPAPAPVAAQPQPQAQPAGVSGIAASFRNPAALQRVWQQVLATLKKKNAAYGVLFLNVRTSFDEATDTLQIQFPAENAFAFKAAQKPDAQKAVADALAQAVGAPIKFAYVQASSSGASSVAQAAPAAAPAPRFAPQAASPAAPPAPAPQPARAAQPAPQAAPSAPMQAPQRFQPEHARPSAPEAAAAGAMPYPPARQAAPAPAAPAYPEPDFPPYDDEVVPYGDEDAFAFEDPSISPYRRQAPASPRNASDVAPWEDLPAAPAQAPAPSPASAVGNAPASPQPGAQDRSEEELNDILLGSFGIRFSEE